MKIIVFFDGVCGLCNEAVDFLIRHDPNRKFFYSPLQGAEIKKFDEVSKADLLDSLLVWDGHQLLSKSEAWLFLMSELGGFYKWSTRHLCVFPSSVVNFLYDFIARYRYKLFGKRPSCRLPSPDEKHLFLD